MGVVWHLRGRDDFCPRFEERWMIRLKSLAGLLLGSVAMVGLSACNQQQPVPVAPAYHHDDGRDRDRRAQQAPPPDRQEARPQDQRDARPQDQRDVRRDKNPQDIPNPRRPQ